MRTVNNQHYAKYRTKQVIRKRQLYKDKCKHNIYLNQCKIRGFTKHFSNKVIKIALKNNKLTVQLNGTDYSIQEFYKLYDINNTLGIFEIDGLFGSTFCHFVDANELLSDLNDRDKKQNLVLHFYDSIVFKK